jgi:hypothetical protein
MAEGSGKPPLVNSPMTTYGFVPVGSRHSEMSINDSVLRNPKIHFRQPPWALKFLSAGMENVWSLIHPLLVCLHGITFGHSITADLFLLPFPLMITAEFVTSHP